MDDSHYGLCVNLLVVFWEHLIRDRRGSEYLRLKIRTLVRKKLDHAA